MARIAGEAASTFNGSADNLPSGERYLYQLFSLIESGNLTVINPDGKTFNFGKAESFAQLRLIIHRSSLRGLLYDQAIAFLRQIGLRVKILLLLDYSVWVKGFVSFVTNALIFCGLSAFSSCCPSHKQKIHHLWGRLSVCSLDATLS